MDHAPRTRWRACDTAEALRPPWPLACILVVGRRFFSLPFLQRRNSPHGTFSPGSVRQVFPLKGAGSPFRRSQLLGLGADEGV